MVWMWHRLFNHSPVEGHLDGFQFLIFWGPSILFSTAAVPIYIPLTVHKRSLFSTSLPVALSLIFIISVLIGVLWYFILVSICTSLMANDAEHLFMCLFAVCISVKCLFMSFAHFLTALWFFLLTFEFECSLYILNTTSLAEYVVC